MSTFQDYDPNVIINFLEIGFAILAVIAVISWIKDRKKLKK